MPVRWERETAFPFRWREELEVTEEKPGKESNGRKSSGRTLIGSIIVDYCLFHLDYDTVAYGGQRIQL